MFHHLSSDNLLEIFYIDIHFLCLQVASLQFGNFYDVQYVKMYGIFMGQLQVCLDRLFLFLFILFWLQHFDILW